MNEEKIPRPQWSGKQSAWNKPLIKNERLDKTFNGIFWFIVIVGMIGIAVLSFYILRT